MYKRNILWLVLALFLGQCASQQPITGGAKDETPPKLLNTTPKDQSLNFIGSTILLEFDEYIEATSIKKELLIAPITEVNYTYKVKKGTLLEIRFDSALEANTTYTLNFREGIKDITEKNSAENLKLAFSTGNYIDSLQIEGNVTSLFSGNPPKEASVLLFAGNDTLTLDGGKPIYVVNTDETGFFRFENLKPGEYQLFGLSEEDGNLKYTKPEETIGFYKETIQLDSNIQNIDIQLTTYDYKELKLISGRPNKQYFDFKFNKSILSFDLKFSNPDWEEKVFAKNMGETLRLFNPLAEADSFQIELTVQDSVGNQIDTTRYVQFLLDQKPKEETFSMLPTPADGQLFLKEDSFQLAMIFSKPVAEYSADSVLQIFALTDSTADTTQWLAMPEFEDFRTKLVFPKSEFKPKMKLVFLKSTFVSVESDTLKGFEINYDVYIPENYGVVSGKIETWAENFTIQLMQNGKVEQEIKNQKEYTFRFVKPGTKTIRILVDDNNNGKFDKGDYKTQTMPEKVIFYDKEIPVKANWEVEADLIEF